MHRHKSASLLSPWIRPCLRISSSHALSHQTLRHTLQMQGRRSLLGSLEHGFQLLLPSCNPERQKQQCYRRTCRDLKAQFIEPTLRPSAEHSSSSEFLPQGHNHLDFSSGFLGIHLCRSASSLCFLSSCSRRSASCFSIWVILFSNSSVTAWVQAQGLMKVGLLCRSPRPHLEASCWPLANPRSLCWLKEVQKFRGVYTGDS